MPELLGLLGQRLDYLRMGMPQGIDRNATGQIDVIAALLIPQSRPVATHRDHVHGGVIGHHQPIEIGAIDLH